ncbi:MAG TPA: hypothetical protein VL495_04145 [Edaphobacter sp.]|nr:hypothetical protein [Edaphobacter sp.]
MKLLAVLFLLFWQAAAVSPPAERQFFLYQRAVVPTAVGLNCAILDAATFAHASASLKDLRLYPQTAQAREIPYAITLSEPVQPDSEPARVFNLGLRGHLLSFDLSMPHRPYTEVVLDLAGTDYIASATVTGMDTPGSQHGTRLGEFTLFDLTSQHLSRSTTLPLEENNFPYLHVDLAVSPAPGTRNLQISPQMVMGATVPPSREAQTVFAPAAETSVVTQRGRQTIVRFRLPERVPAERISFVLAPDFRGNFSRDIVINDHAVNTPTSAGETISGNIFRVRLTQVGREIHQQRLSVPATLGSNLQSDADVEIAINNGDDPPLPITSVRLEMRQRRLCFAAWSTDSLTLFYGDSALSAPVYDFARTVSLSNQIPFARVGPEQKNPVYTSRPDTRALTERHPELVWIAFLAVICILGIVAIRASRHLPH